MQQEYMIPQKRKQNVVKTIKQEPTFVQEIMGIMKTKNDTKLPDLNNQVSDEIIAKSLLQDYITNTGIDKELTKFYSDTKNKGTMFPIRVGNKVYYLKPIYMEGSNLPSVFNVFSEGQEKEAPFTLDLLNLQPKVVAGNTGFKKALTTPQDVKPPVIDKPQQPEDGGGRKSYLDIYDLSVPEAEALSRRVKFVPEPKNWRDALWSGANLASGAVLEGVVNLIRENVAKEVAKKALEAYAKSSDLIKEQANINQQLADIDKQFKATEDVNKQRELQQKKLELENKNKLIQKQLNLANEVVPRLNKEKAEIAIKMADLDRRLQEARTEEEYKQALIELQKEKQKLQDAWKRLEIEAKKQSSSKPSLTTDDLKKILETK